MRALFLGLAQQRQKMLASGRWTVAPDDDELAVLDISGVWRPARAARSLASRLGSRAADRALQPARAHAIPQPLIADDQLQQSESPTVGVGQDSRRAIARDNFLPASGDF